jgi:hypothetical protein
MAQGGEDADGRFRAGQSKLLVCLVTDFLVCLVTNFFQTRDLIGLGALAALDDVEFNLIALFETFIALALDGAVVNEDVCPAIAAEEAVTLCVVKPLHGALVLCQWSYSLTFLSERLHTAK